MSNDFEKYNKKTLAGVAKDAEAFAIRDLLAETNRNIQTADIKYSDA